MTSPGASSISGLTITRGLSNGATRMFMYATFDKPIDSVDGTSVLLLNWKVLDVNGDGRADLGGHEVQGQGAGAGRAQRMDAGSGPA